MAVSLSMPPPTRSPPRPPSSTTMDVAPHEPLQFAARVCEQKFKHQPAAECKSVVTLRSHRAATVLELQRYRTSADLVKRSPSANCYPAGRCVKITEWAHVKSHACMAVHFLKDPASGEAESRKSRTQVHIVTIRDWSAECSQQVRSFWEILNRIACSTALSHKKKKTPQPATSAAIPRIPNTKVPQNSVISKHIRLRERSFGNRPVSLPSSRISQGRRMVDAMAAASSKSPYSALTRGATGKKVYASALIGSPNLSHLESLSSQGTNPARTTPSKSARSSIPKNRSPSLRDSRQNTPVFDLTHNSSQPVPTQPVQKSADGPPPSSPSPQKRKLPSQQLDQSHAPAAKIQCVTKVAKAADTAPTYSPEKRITRSASGNNRVGRTLSAGIANDGNTCYLSAVLQTMMSDSVFMQTIHASLKSRERNLLPFTSALADLSDQRTSSSVMQSKAVRAAVSHHFEEFSSSRQQDVHEFFLRCLDVLDREFTGCELSSSPTQSNFCLVQERKFICTSCGQSTDPRNEILRGLSLDIPEHDANTEDTSASIPNLQQLVDQFFAPQAVDLNCEKCTSGKQARSSSEILFAPRVLALHIKRFRVARDDTGGTVSVEKVADNISLPNVLSLDSSLSPKAVSFRRLYEPSVMPPFQFPVAESKVEKAPVIDDDESNAVRAVKSRKTSSSGKRVQARFRIHSKDGTYSTNASAIDDEIDEDAITSYTQFQADVLDAHKSEDDKSNQVAALLPFGLSRVNAMRLLKKCSYDTTAAIAAALDMRKNSSSATAHLDDALLSHVSSLTHSQADGSRLHSADLKYRLISVIRHCSNTTEHGHYVTDVRQSDGSWICYDDASSSRLTSTEVQSKDGYMCYYIAE